MSGDSMRPVVPERGQVRLAIGLPRAPAPGLDIEWLAGPVARPLVRPEAGVDRDPCGVGGVRVGVVPLAGTQVGVPRGAGAVALGTGDSEMVAHRVLIFTGQSIVSRVSRMAWSFLSAMAMAFRRDATITFTRAFAASSVACHSFPR